jgi:hypothetical protein
MNIVVAAFGRSAGDVVFDPSLPVEDVQATVYSAALGYYRSMNLFGRSANIRVAMPYAFGNMQGLVAGTYTSLYRSGLADMRVQLSANILGAPALNLSQLAEHRNRTTVWTSITMGAPTGQYDSARFVNIGTNRWAFKPEVAVSHVIDNWTLEGYAGVWLFTNNSKYQGNQLRRQSPLLAYQAHVSRNLKGRFWVAGDFTYYHGGASRVNGVARQDFLRNARVGGTISIPVSRLQSVKFVYAATTYARLGGSFGTISVAYAVSWMD